MITPDRIRQRRHRARVRAEAALQPVEAATVRAALKAMLRLREQLREWVNSPQFAQLPLEKQIPIHGLLGHIDGSLESSAIHHRQLADRITKVLNAEEIA